MKEIEIAELGSIKLQANSRAKHVTVRYRNSAFYLTHPRGMTEKEIERVIREMHHKLLLLKEKTPPITLLTPDSNLQTFSFRVQLQANNCQNPYVNLKDACLHITYPISLDIAEKETQQFFRDTIEKYCRIEAKRLLPLRVDILAKQHNFEVNSVKINNSKGRWGSCSGKKNINLSYFCMMLPERLIDLVILHELCHTKEMNHGTHFWALLDSVTQGESQRLTQELRKFRLPW